MASAPSRPSWVTDGPRRRKWRTIRRPNENFREHAGRCRPPLDHCEERGRSGLMPTANWAPVDRPLG
eukprot:1682277-Alexandrium_andersonii.AAC.1